MGGGGRAAEEEEEEKEEEEEEEEEEVAVEVKEEEQSSVGLGLWVGKGHSETKQGTDWEAFFPVFLFFVGKDKKT